MYKPKAERGPLMYLWWSLYTLHLHACYVRVTVGLSGLCCCTCVKVEFIYPVFTRMPGELP